ncbi:hypothetical protein LOTGIDRAFT_234556 [Lottia gigantea]|uniref:Death domain-containing protein n=1 Tax=Lottia gigantea TaxID=225164 RepID=V4BIQ2_LOTGI|nr:hypothetical protein LOTGIDRAFT_234556 [Lottia gigantea]ESO88504.1 hypothetical protein LOTGIDRAFT_234556 [Lottia gigantea]
MASRKPSIKKKKMSDSVDSMKKDISCNVSTGTEHPRLVEEANLKASYQPGKKGGNFGLPLGAKLTVPEGNFNKKESITCQVTSPSTRWRHCPQLPADEHITSEIFKLTSSVHIMKTPIIVQLPYYPLQNDKCEINVKGKWRGELEWVDVGFLKKSDTKPPSVELELDRLGQFIVTFTCKQEIFNVTSQGCLHNARISRYISCRFPRKATESNLQCAIKILPIPQEKLEEVKKEHARECNDLVTTTEFIDIIPSIPCNFRRSVTVKLPLPSGIEIEKEQEPNVGVLLKNGSAWELVESHQKFTRTTVSVDVKSLGRFCVAISNPERKPRLREAIRFVEGSNDTDKGEIVLYLSLQEKSWEGVVECLPEHKAKSRIADRQDRGFKVINKVKVVPKVEEKRVYSRRYIPPKETKPVEPEGFDIYDGLSWEICVGSDIKITNDSDISDNSELCYYRHLPESYRKFEFEPLKNDENTLSGVVELVPIGIEDEQLIKRLTIRFEFVIDEDTVKNYFKPEFVPEPEPEKIRVTFDLPELKPIKEEKPPPVVPVQKIKTISASVMDRLTKSTKKPRIIDREARVITGKSLMNLSRKVPEGLTLAVHLDLPDSTITGLGFDAISNGLTMADVTYKILLYWKRKLKDKRDSAVNELVSALGSMGRPDIGAIILHCHHDNKELTEEYLNNSVY